MIPINCGHPLSACNLQEMQQSVDRLLEVALDFDPREPLAEQVLSLIKSMGLTSSESQTEPIVANPPSPNVIVTTLLAEVHGRTCCFPPMVRLGPVASALPPRYEVAEVINLLAIRDAARQRPASLSADWGAGC